MEDFEESHEYRGRKGVCQADKGKHGKYSKEWLQYANWERLGEERALRDLKDEGATPEEEEAAFARIVEVHERAVAQVPSAEEKKTSETVIQALGYRWDSSSTDSNILSGFRAASSTKSRDHDADG
ncbi:hypothetical protein C0992_006772 [Termitomyces sp. T32_za158]|nr:hypothetical protein C0992_006772 [Termitomyces sp. T32_za158]